MHRRVHSKFDILCFVYGLEGTELMVRNFCTYQDCFVNLSLSLNLYVVTSTVAMCDVVDKCVNIKHYWIKRFVSLSIFAFPHIHWLFIRFFSCQALIGFGRVNARKTYNSLKLLCLAVGFVMVHQYHTLQRIIGGNREENLLFYFFWIDIWFIHKIYMVICSYTFLFRFSCWKVHKCE